MAQHIFCKKEYIQRILKNRKEGFYTIKLSDGTMHVPSVERGSRFLSGKSHAINRLFQDYTNNKSVLKNLNKFSEIIIFDVGSNIGEFTLKTLESYPNSKAYVFEPDNLVFKCLVLNLIDFNRLNSRVHFQNYALGEKEETKKFYVSSDSGDSSIIRPKKFKKISNVQCRRLDRVISELGIDQIDVVKIDAEGYEPEVLKGMGLSISKTKLFLIDVGPERYGEETVTEVSEILEHFNFKVNIHLNRGGRKFLSALNLNEE